MSLIEAVIASGFLVENNVENDATTISNVKQESNPLPASNATKSGPDVQISMGSDLKNGYSNPVQSI